MTMRMRVLIAAAALSLAASAMGSASAGTSSAPTHFNEFTISQFQSLMASGQLSSVGLTNYYINRIQDLDREGPGVNAVIELNPDALSMAKAADQARAAGKNLGPLMGIPVLLKANIDTGDKMQTTAGSFALFGAPAARDSTVAANLRANGAVILGKTNLSEWANFRSFESSSGWSGVGGETNNPYGINRNACGSSSGSGAAASANFAAVSLGTETDGSVVCPGNVNGVVGLKPTIGLTSRAGVVPISHTQDTVGVHARTVADAAMTLGVIQSPTFDGRDAATGGVPLGWQGTGKTRPNIPTDYTKFLDKNGLKGATLGLTRQGLGGFDPLAPTPAKVTDAYEAAFDQLTAAGATVIDLDNTTTFNFFGGPGEFEVLCFEFRNDVKNYLSTRTNVPAAGGTLQTLIDFDNANASREMPFFNQDIFDLCNSMAPGPDDPQPAFGGQTYNQALSADQAYAQQNVDAALSSQHLDAIVSATDNPAWATDLLFGDRFFFGTSSIAAAGGYPIIQVPATSVDGAPMGLSFFGTAFSEPKLIKLASGWEAFNKWRANPNNLPTFAHTLPFNNIQGPTLTKPHPKSPMAPADPARKKPHNV
ncbi:MAG: amidase [Chloroflexi bacterium]|nr:MAG: amidase [Chloroflexota bacterium]